MVHAVLLNIILINVWKVLVHDDNYLTTQKNNKFYAVAYSDAGETIYK